MPQPQSFERHARYVPLFHFVLAPILLVNFVWRAVVLFRAPGWEPALGLLMAVAFILMFLSMRGFTVTVQDRVIRQEERLRLERLLPAELRSKIGEFTAAQLVALRFASDGELPGLARRVLDEKIADKKSIKGLIQQWRADELRA
ncbi:MAG: DUF6526 family protein [Gemmatimonadota bacterium]